MKEKIEQTLHLLPEVKWDRWMGELTDELGIGIYGWLPRQDGKADFVFIRIDADGPWMFVTSSVQHSSDFAARLGMDAHGECKRAADHFKIK